MADFSDLGGQSIDFSDLGGEVVQPKKRGLMGRSWDALAIPEQKSREGLQMLAGMVPKPEPKGRAGVMEEAVRQQFPMLRDVGPQPGVIEDVMRGAPKIAADTVAEVAPSFVSRESLLMGGAGLAAKGMKPLVKPVLQGIGRQAESLSGAMPGSLQAAYKDSGLMFGPGRKAASEAYEAAKAGEKIEYGANLTPARKFFNQAYAKAQAGTLKPIEALEARKVADDLYESGSFVGDEILQKRKVLDKIAKESFEAADTGFKRALQSESLRNVLPQTSMAARRLLRLSASIDSSRV